MGSAGHRGEKHRASGKSRNSTDASGTFNTAVREAAWTRMADAGAPLMDWFGAACELHGDWRNDLDGRGTLLANHIPASRNLMTSSAAKKNYPCRDLPPRTTDGQAR